MESNFSENDEVQYLSYYEELNGSSSRSVRQSKHYKQCYRPAWENLAYFKGWLRGVEGEPNRAYCTYCQKTLHAHRLSLLKHTTTSKHRKAAEYFVKNDESNVNGGHFEQNISPHMIQFLKPPKTEIGICEEVELTDNEDDTMEEPEVELIEDNNLKSVNDSESPISTHVTDNTTGKPISDLRVTLYQLNNGRWSHISEGVTNASGVFNKFIERADFTAGRYKLRYDVDRYFLAQKQKSRFPFIEIIFDASLMDTCHIPVFVSPHAYSAFGGT